MPYIAIKAYPKDEDTKKKVVDEINEVFKKYAYLILSIVGAVLFVCYDLLITHFQKTLDKTIEKLKL